VEKKQTIQSFVLVHVPLQPTIRYTSKERSKEVVIRVDVRCVAVENTVKDALRKTDL
jgi:hypothetical protein